MWRGGKNITAKQCNPHILYYLNPDFLDFRINRIIKNDLNQGSDNGQTPWRNAQTTTANNRRGVARNAPNAVTLMVGYHTHVCVGADLRVCPYVMLQPRHGGAGVIVGATFTVALVQLHGDGGHHECGKMNHRGKTGRA
jgi:hypothetical protein